MIVPRKVALFFLLLAVGWAEAQRHQHSHQHSHSHRDVRNGNGYPGGRPRTGFRSSAYYVNWATYGRNYNPQDLPVNDLTHVLYAFANLHPQNGTVYLSDPWADYQKTFPTDDTTATGNNMYGVLKQLFLQKKRNRNLKTLLSIGGWTYSPNFAPAASTEAGRQQFARSAVQILQDYGFDGIDVDWEYPQNEVEADNWVKLLKATRAALDASSSKNNQTRFLLEVACPAGPQNYQRLKVADMDQFLDHWNLMAYDYAGGFSNLTGHMANIYPSVSNPASTEFNTIDPVEFYTTNGVAPGKLSLGIPLYGRQFVNTTGLGQPYQSVGLDGSWEAGVWDYKDLPRPGASEFYDPKVGASWSYDNFTRTLVSYDTVASVKQKAMFARTARLGGAMYWETSADRPAGQGGLINTFNQAFGGNFAVASNELRYPETQYDNLRAGFPGE